MISAADVRHITREKKEITVKSLILAQDER